MSGTNPIPPKGDFKKAEKYINQLVSLVNQNLIEVYRTDLKKFDPTSLKDHYTISLKEYQIEISHSKTPSSDKDSFVMIFNNLENLSAGRGEKVILAYIYLADSQYAKFKLAVERQIQDREKAEEEKKFNQALKPIDELLSQVQGETKKEELKPIGSYSFGDNQESQNRSSENFEPLAIHQI